MVICQRFGRHISPGEQLAMLDPSSQAVLKAEIARQIAEDQGVLSELREEVRPLLTQTRRIAPRTTTSISLVAADGGNNQLRFDPFLVQIVRVVDSSNNEYCLEVLSPTTSVSALSQRQFGSDGQPTTALGRLMDHLGVRQLDHLSHMIRSEDDGRPRSP